MPATCGACRRPIIWVKTVKGRSMPLDPSPNPDGNVLVGPDGLAEVHQGPLPAGAPGKVYVPHWATCTNPDAFRGRKK